VTILIAALFRRAAAFYCRLYFCGDSTTKEPWRLDITVSNWHLTPVSLSMGVRTQGQMGSADPLENEWKIKKRKHAKKSSFLCLCYILRAIRAGRCREQRYADHIFIQLYFRMHHFVVIFSKFPSPQAARGHWTHNQNPADVLEPIPVSGWQLRNWCPNMAVRQPRQPNSGCWRKSRRRSNHLLLVCAGDTGSGVRTLKSRSLGRT